MRRARRSVVAARRRHCPRIETERAEAGVCIRDADHRRRPCLMLAVERRRLCNVEAARFRLAGLLNQKPMWNVLVGCRSTSGSKPKIWSMMIENNARGVLQYGRRSRAAAGRVRLRRILIFERSDA